MKDRRVTISIRDMERQSRGRDAKTPTLRPRTRGDCLRRPRPCPYVSCRYHLFLDITPIGSIKMPFGDEVEALSQMEHTCSLDAADAGEHTMTKIGQYMGVTGARAQQEVVSAMAKLRRLAEEAGLSLEDLIHGLDPGGEGALGYDLMSSMPQEGEEGG